MPGKRTRNLVRVLVGGALLLAVTASVWTPVPEDPPAVAFGQTGIYRLEIALIAFYGSLLLVTPAVSGLILGRLPTEISTRGARFAEEADQSSDWNRAAIKDLRRTTEGLTDRLIDAELKIDELKRVGDST